jgi:hypothetical protein
VTYVLAVGGDVDLQVSKAFGSIDGFGFGLRSSVIADASGSLLPSHLFLPPLTAAQRFVVIYASAVQQRRYSALFVLLADVCLAG